MFEPTKPPNYTLLNTQEVPICDPGFTGQSPPTTNTEKAWATSTREPQTSTWLQGCLVCCNLALDNMLIHPVAAGPMWATPVHGDPQIRLATSRSILPRTCLHMHVCTAMYVSMRAMYWNECKARHRSWIAVEWNATEQEARYGLGFRV